MFRRKQQTATGNGNGNGNGHGQLDQTSPESFELPANSRIVIETGADPNKGKDKKKKLPLWPFFVLGLVGICLVVIIFFVFRGLTRTTQVQMAVDDPRTSAAKKTIEQQKSADALADKLVSTASIEEARKQTTAPATAPLVNPSGAATPLPGTTALKGYPYAASGSTSLPSGTAGTVPSQTGQTAPASTSANTGQTAPASSSQTSSTSSGAAAPRRSTAPRQLPDSTASTQQSFRYKPAPTTSRGGASDSGNTGGDALSNNYSFSQRDAARTSSAAAAAALPPFGTMLPVRTLGAVYTLRSSTLVRLEITRDVSGRGWSLRRGTVMVATLKESQIDRAFLAVTGFIDPQSGNLVRVGGDVLGQDGAAGLKGRRRTVGSAWLRAAGKVASTGLAALPSLLAGRNGGSTTIINGAQDPLDAELDGIQKRNQVREFVEVQAGTYGYVMVSDLPPDSNGQQTDPNNSGQPNLYGVLSDSEIAALLTSGTPEQIRAALPKLPPNLRIVAESLLKTGN